MVECTFTYMKMAECTFTYMKMAECTFTYMRDTTDYSWNINK